MKKKWIGSWTAAPMNVWSSDTVLPGFFNQTIRETCRISLGGSSLCVRLTNEFGDRPIELSDVRIANAFEHGAIQPHTSRQLTFNGEVAGHLPPGTALISDPIEMIVAPLSVLSISAYTRGYLPIQTHHYEAQQTTFISLPGNFTEARIMPLEQMSTSRYLVSAVYVNAEENSRAVVCVGDSLTDGYGSETDGNSRWPDILAQILQAYPALSKVAVLNQGIGGNRLLTSRRGLKLSERLDRDVFAYSGVSHMIVAIGINDIGWPNTPIAGPDEVVSASEITVGLNQICRRAELAGVRAIVATLAPFQGAMMDSPMKSYYNGEKERIRAAVNSWIRSGAHGCPVVDFDEVLNDPAHPQRLRPEFDCGDHLHPNNRGYVAMARSIDLKLLEE